MLDPPLRLSLRSSEGERLARRPEHLTAEAALLPAKIPSVGAQGPRDSSNALPCYSKQTLSEFQAQKDAPSHMLLTGESGQKGEPEPLWLERRERMKDR